MASLRDLFLERIQKVRTDLQSSLGFQPLFGGMLDDVRPFMAIQFPASIYSNKDIRISLQYYVMRIFADNGLDCQGGTYKDSESYAIAYCGSRCTTLILHQVWEFYVGIRLEPVREGIGRHIPKVPTWSVLEVSYDDVKPEEKKYIGYYTYEYKAVLNSENKEEAKVSMEADILVQMQSSQY